jgi:hypothetical protein
MMLQYNLLFSHVKGRTETDVKVAVFWVVVQCSLVEVYRLFRGPYVLHHQGGES